MLLPANVEILWIVDILKVWAKQVMSEDETTMRECDQDLLVSSAQ